MADWGQGGQGAAGGAMTGAAMGSAIMPGWGTAIGGVAGGLLGGLGGLFGGGGTGEYQDLLKKMADGYGKRTAPQGKAVTAGQSQLTGNRAALIAQLEAQARGEGPSAARLQMQEAMDRAAGAQASAAAGAGGRGVNAGAALRNAANNTAAIQAQGARDTATLRAQEQIAATGQLGGVIGQGINADNSLNTWNAGAQNQMTQANMQAMLQQMGLNDEAQLRALLGAMGAAGPGLGTQILAGGASAMPGILGRKAQSTPAQPGQVDFGQGFGGMGQALGKTFGSMGGMIPTGGGGGAPLSPDGIPYY